MLGTPFFCVHPCKTAALMETVLSVAVTGHSRLPEHDPSNTSTALIRELNGNGNAHTSILSAATDLACSDLKAGSCAGTGSAAAAAVVTECGYLLSWLSIIGPVVGVRLSLHSITGKPDEQSRAKGID